MTWNYLQEPKQYVDECNLCSSRGAFEVATEDRYGYDVRHVQCPKCGLLWITPRLTADGYRRYYETGAYRTDVSEWHGEEINARTVQQDQIRYAEALGELIGAWDTVLDVGGSTGAVGEAIGKRVTVLDPAPTELEHASGEQILSTIEDWQPDGRKWDVILVCRAVDHFLDIAGALAKLRGCLAQPGQLWIDAVDYRVVASRLGKLESALKLDHPFALTEDTLLRYLKAADFAPIEARFDGDHAGFLCV